MTVSRRNFLSFNFLANIQPVGSDDADLQLLNRITWGVRPEELARVREIGRNAYIDEQLNPDSIDDSKMDDRLARKPLLSLGRLGLYGINNYDERLSVMMILTMIERAIYSRRQLLERMVDFWTDHFNIPLEEQVPELVIFQRDVIRKHALGNFQQLLSATAKSPAMLVYLDNYVNVAEHPNENYARELLELHTMGVDGGYTEQDVKEIARAFTGWTTHNRTRTGFYFDPATHDDGAKAVLGQRLSAGRGIEDGYHVLGILARHPSTAHFICGKLCRRFVSDTPPAALVDGAAQVWGNTNGDIVAVMRHILTSEEFAESAGQKLRRPLDFFVGALRATGTEFTDFYRMEETLIELGQLPYGWHPPNGYPDVAGAWASTSGMLSRWNLSMLITHAVTAGSEYESWGVRTDLMSRMGRPKTVDDLVDVVATEVFGVPLSAENKSEFIAYAADGAGPSTPVDAHLLTKKGPSLFGLMLASPLFQWR